jgi:hypothetical protein
MIKYASIYRKGNKYVIHSYSITTMGLSISSEPYLILEGTFSVDEICDCITLALSQSKTNIAHPTDWNRYSKLFLANMQEKSLKNLHANNAITCEIIEENNNITLYPMMNRGVKEGFMLIPDCKFTFPKSELKENIYVALNLCM